MAAAHARGVQCWLLPLALLVVALAFAAATSPATPRPAWLPLVWVPLLAGAFLLLGGHGLTQLLPPELRWALAGLGQTGLSRPACSQPT
jgi:hypothetical protein